MVGQSVRMPDPLAGVRHPRFITQEHISTGLSGTTLLCNDATDNNQLVVIKFIRRGGFVNHDHIEREVLHHSRMHHPHMVKVKEVLLTDEHLGIVMEYVTGGNLRAYVTALGCLSEPAARCLFQQVILAVDYCHKLGVVNRDIKLDNVLLQPVKDVRLLIAKLIDLGTSKAFCMKRRNTEVSTAMYICPESLVSANYDGKAADIWRCGVMLYIMLVGENPWKLMEDKATRVKRCRAIIDAIIGYTFHLPEGHTLSPECMDLLHKDPAQRITMEQILTHPWFKENLPQGADTLNQKCLSEQSSTLQQSEGDMRRMLRDAFMPILRVLPSAPPAAPHPLEAESKPPQPAQPAQPARPAQPAQLLQPLTRQPQQPVAVPPPPQLQPIELPPPQPIHPMPLASEPLGILDALLQTSDMLFGLACVDSPRWPSGYGWVLTFLRTLGAFIQCVLAVDLNMVVLHRPCMEHMHETMPKYLFTINDLQLTCQKREDTGCSTVSNDFLVCLERLGGSCNQLCKKIYDWCTMPKASLLRSMLQKEEYDDIQQMLLAFHVNMNMAAELLPELESAQLPPESVATQLSPESVATQLPPESVAALPTVDPAQIEEVKRVIQADMQVFRFFGLSFKHIVRDWLRETGLSNLVVKTNHMVVVKELGDNTSLVRFSEHDTPAELRVFKRFDRVPGAQEAVSSDAFLLSMLDHPNVLRLHGVVMEPEVSGLVMDHHGLGSLQRLIQGASDSTLPVTLVERVELALQVAQGMQYLHEYPLGPIIHGNLKPSHVLVSSDRRAIIDLAQGPDMARMRLLDDEPNMTHVPSAQAYSLYYQAPEVLLQLLNGKKCQPPSDVFSFGVLLYELMTLQPVHKDFAPDVEGYQTKIERGLRPSIPRELPEALQHCITMCWQHNPEKRPSFAAVVVMLASIHTDKKKAVDAG